MKPTSLVSNIGKAKLAGTFFDGLATAPDNPLIGMVVSGCRRNVRETVDEDYLTYNDMMSRIGMLVQTGMDMIDYRPEESLSRRIVDVANSVGDEDLDDETILKMLGFVQTSHRSNFVVEDGMPSVIGAGLGSKWTAIQPEEFFSWVDEVSGGRTIATGLMREGSLLYAASDSPEDIPAFRAVKSFFLTFIESFDGKTACQAIPTLMLPNNVAVRIRDKDASWNYRHTKNAKEKIADKIQVWNDARNVWYKAIKMMEEMMEIKFDFSKVVESIYPADENGEVGSRRESNRDTLWQAYSNLVDDEYKGTLFGGWLALVSWDTWLRPGRDTKPLVDRQVETFCGGQQKLLDQGRDCIAKAYGKPMIF